MTKSQYRAFSRLRKRQVNRDATVVESSNTSITFHIPFPGLYLTYNEVGSLLLTETEAQRIAGNKRLKGAAEQGGEMGSDLPYTPPMELDDDDDAF